MSGKFTYTPFPTFPETPVSADLAKKRELIFQAELDDPSIPVNYHVMFIISALIEEDPGPEKKLYVDYTRDGITFRIFKKEVRSSVARQVLCKSPAGTVVVLCRSLKKNSKPHVRFIYDPEKFYKRDVFYGKVEELAESCGPVVDGLVKYAGLNKE